MYSGSVIRVRVELYFYKIIGLRCNFNFETSNKIGKLLEKVSVRLQYMKLIELFVIMVTGVESHFLNN